MTQQRVDQEIAQRIVDRHVAESNVDVDPPELAKVSFLINATGSDADREIDISAETKTRNGDVPVTNVTDYSDTTGYDEAEILVIKEDLHWMDINGILEGIKFNSNIRYILSYGSQFDEDTENPAIEDFVFVSGEDIIVNDASDRFQTFKRQKVYVR
jgi:hypothetical protein